MAVFCRFKVSKTPIMRILLTVLTALSIASCAAQTPPSLSPEVQKSTSEVSSVKEISYKRQSRGGNSLTTFSEGEMVVYEANQKSKSFKLTNKDWNELKTLVGKLSISQISALEAPTNKRLYDGAASAVVTIVKDKKSYSSSAFDDGRPPKEILELVEKLLSLEEAGLKN
jgi:hypothetical protein